MVRHGLIRPSVPGLGIRSVVFRANRLLFVSKGANSDSLFSKSEFLWSLFFKEQWKRIAHSCSLRWATVSESHMVVVLKERPWANRSRCSLKKSNGAKSDGNDSHKNGKSSENYQKNSENNDFFSSESLVFWERKSKSVIRSKKNERITHVNLC